MTDYFQDDLEQMAAAKERIGHPIVTHDTAANLIQQLKAKDEEIAALKASREVIQLNLTAAVDAWLESLRHILERDQPNPETPEREVWDKLDKIYWPLFDCVATALNAAKNP